MAYFSRIISFSVLSLLIALACEARVLLQSSGFVQTRNTQFILNGSPFFFNGFNSYWMMNVAADPSQRSKVSDVFSQAAAARLSVCRTWAFNDGGTQALQISPGVYDERVFQGLDFVISEAKKNGVRLILSLSNNYKDFGGRPQYVNWARNAGAPVNSDDDFYANEVVKGYYKNHVKGWIQEMASFVKSIDSNHLLTVGMEGFYGDSMPEKKAINPGYQVGTDFISNHLIKEIDFSTIHAYPDIWLSGKDDSSQMAFMLRWMTSHLTDSETIINKPMVFSEFGKSSKDPGYSLSARDSFLNAVYTNIYNFARSGGIGGGLVWQLMAEGMQSYDDGYEIVLSQNPSTSSVITQQSNKMAVLDRV
ncbi:Mannan endo-1,4-beta-mannosidase 5 [Vitis vinifera]|uniref:mannan endo-1,4-beta-mannosidase n=1 Tax=Vitis vinifera TaxID=29760 RepID=A0A438FRM6_VITVI|nr:Mannan endo-1,4-beta-mannosidase 5 [Vitis vinifera]